MKNKLETVAPAPSEDFTRRGHGIGAQLFSSVSHFKGVFIQHHLQELNSEEAEVSVEENPGFPWGPWPSSGDSGFTRGSWADVPHLGRRKLVPQILPG